MDQPAPTSPGISRRPRGASRSYSMHSEKSNKSANTPQSPQEKAEKERRDSFMRGESKANPNAAVQELQPQARNVLEKVTLDSIRAVPAKDATGNVITEPDLSNPTRPRWERPLDTIRSFEKAIDGDYRRRSHQRSTSDFDRDNQYGNRRSSYYGNNGPPNARYNNGGGGYYNSRPESNYDQYGAAPPPPRQRFARGMSEGGMGRYHNGYGVPSYGHNNASYDGSDSTSPWNNSTDPSSQNSSFERLNGAPKPGQSPEHNYGMESHRINEESDDYGFAPRPPPKGNYASPSSAAPPRAPIKLGGGSSAEAAFASQGGQLPSTVRPTPEKEKRSSWLSRRFSKSK